MSYQGLLGNMKFTSRIIASRRLMRKGSHLLEAGWYESVRLGMPCDSLGKELPWYTYAAINFLGPRLEESMSVFEYGSGNSTLWWARRVSYVVSCEHDGHWYGLMQGKIPANVDYRLLPLSGEPECYRDEVSKFGERFDVVVIDGRDRVACAKNALPALKSAGVIVWDNSDRERYQEGFRFLRDQGFRRLDFSGMGPMNAYGWCTSVFYRSENCLGI